MRLFVEHTFLSCIMKNILLSSALVILVLNTKVMAQDHKIYRIAKITVDIEQIDKYSTALKEQMAAAISIEPGVLSYYAVSDKEKSVAYYDI